MRGGRAGTIGSLLLGIHDDDGNLVYAGHVGTGFNAKTLDELSTMLGRLERKTSPYAFEIPRADAKDAHWVTPTVVGRGALRRVDLRRAAAAPLVPWAATGQERVGGAS